MKQRLGLLWRGMAMGVAEVVPGVSGGTIALITGIYATLVSSLASFGLASVTLLAQPRAFAQHHNLAFLITLGLGMLVGIVLFGRVMQFLLEAYKPMVWAFFCGLIAASAWVLGRARAVSVLYLFMPAGLLAGVGLTLLPAWQSEPSLPVIFGAGAIAVTAWVLPAVSGSYMLVVFGLYEAVIDALNNLDLLFLGVFAAGCAVGLLLFVRVVAWLLGRFYERLMSFLTGFMLGSLLNIWPWQDPHAAQRLDGLLLPGAYTLSTGAASNWQLCLLCAAVGAICLLWLSKFNPQESA